MHKVRHPARHVRVTGTDIEGTIAFADLHINYAVRPAKLNTTGEPRPVAGD